MIIPAIIGAKPASGGGYVASAVHFSGGGNTLLTRSLTSTDSPHLLAAFCFMIPEDNPDGNVPFFVNDPDNSLSILIAAAVSDGAVEDFIVNLEDFDASNQLIFHADPPPTIGVWHNVQIAAKTDLGAGLKQAKIYMDDVDVTSIMNDSGASFSMVMNGLPAYIGEDQGDHLIGNVANYFIKPANVLVAGDIPEATRRLFIDADGKPVDPAVAVLALGNPVILLNGDATAFRVNQGTGGALTLSRYIKSGVIAAPGPTSIVLTGATIGNAVSFVNRTSGVDVSDQFETTITVTNQIQQTGETDFTDAQVRVALTPGVLTNAGSSPSD